MRIILNISRITEEETQIIHAYEKNTKRKFLNGFKITKPHLYEINLKYWWDLDVKIGFK